MASAPACFSAFGELLAAEYSSPDLIASVHRLTVDTWAAQHPGDEMDRRAVQSVGLHLARLAIQLDHPRPPAETNAVMLDFSRHKTTLRYLPPPRSFKLTVADVAPFAGTVSHAERVREWAQATWGDWEVHHGYIRRWIDAHSPLARRR